jgi:hypothetical protein
MFKGLKIIFFIFLLGSCSPETSNNISGALNNITRMGLETLKDSLNERSSSGSIYSAPKTVCMWNPNTQGMSQCHHVTAIGGCAHYGAPCS